MHALAAPLPPLPAVLVQARHTPARRHLVGDFPLDERSLRQFNALLDRLQRPPLACDQLATAARDLTRHASHRSPEPIARRLAIACQIERMLADRGWSPDPATVMPARLVVDYLHSDRGLIPSCVPGVGHLDDAILIDAAWPQLEHEVEDFLDYCRLRAVEASLHDYASGQPRFSRADWQQARRHEAALIAHCKRVGASSYLPASTSALFHVC